MNPAPQPQVSTFNPRLLCLFGLLLAPLTGCHSAFVQTTVINKTGGPLHLFEVDYPSASFGGQDLKPDAQFHYRFKVLGEGPLKLTWTDAAEKDHSAAGPDLHEGQEGDLTITILPQTATWDTHVRAK